MLKLMYAFLFSFVTFDWFYSEEDDNTMLTVVPLFMTFLPVVSVCELSLIWSYL